MLVHMVLGEGVVVVGEGVVVVVFNSGVGDVVGAGVDAAGVLLVAVGGAGHGGTGNPGQ
jgi:hypothetical protein